MPTLFCRETNWTSLGMGFGIGVWSRNASGEVWQLITTSASPMASVWTTGELLASNSLPGHLVAAFDGKPELFELRGDGTLWEKAYPISAMFVVSPDEKWRQVGKRLDWQAIWGSGSTGFGLTADGTLWTWGVDPTRDGNWSFAEKFQMMLASIKEMLAHGPGWGRMGYGTPPAIQKTPRPLLRLVDSARPQTSPGVK
jgi:hypothetical protein